MVRRNRPNDVWIRIRGGSGEVTLPPEFLSEAFEGNLVAFE